MSAKSLQSCPILCNPKDCNLPGFPVHGILQARIPDWVAIPFSRDLPDPGIEPVSPGLAGGFFTTKPPENPSFLHGGIQSVCHSLPQIFRPLMWMRKNNCKNICSGTVLCESGITTLY